MKLAKFFQVGSIKKGLRRRESKADWFGGEYRSDMPAIVVGGCARSGTTLMRVMLDTHRHICCGPESWLFTPEKIVINGLSKKFSLGQQQVNDIYWSAGSRTEFIDRFFQAYCHLTKKKRWAEKTPKNVLQLEYIFRGFPSSKFIHMIRDGRDVVCSLRTFPRYKVDGETLVPLNTWKPIENCIDQWISSIEASRRFWSHPCYLEIHYEDLVRDTRPMLEKVISFLEEPWDENMINYYLVDSPSRDFRKIPQNPEANEPLKERAIGRWREDFLEKDKAIFKKMAGDLLIELGYESTNNW